MCANACIVVIGDARNCGCVYFTPRSCEAQLAVLKIDRAGLLFMRMCSWQARVAQRVRSNICRIACGFASKPNACTWTSIYVHCNIVSMLSNPLSTPWLISGLSKSPPPVIQRSKSRRTSKSSGSRMGMSVATNDSSNSNRKSRASLKEVSSV